MDINSVLGKDAKIWGFIFGESVILKGVDGFANPVAENLKWTN
jgi:hypothetical protein